MGRRYRHEWLLDVPQVFERPTKTSCPLGRLCNEAWEIVSVDLECAESLPTETKVVQERCVERICVGKINIK